MKRISFYAIITLALAVNSLANEEQKEDVHAALRKIEEIFKRESESEDAKVNTDNNEISANGNPQSDSRNIKRKIEDAELDKTIDRIMLLLKQRQNNKPVQRSKPQSGSTQKNHKSSSSSSSPPLPKTPHMKSSQHSTATVGEDKLAEGHKDKGESKGKPQQSKLGKSDSTTADGGGVPKLQGKDEDEKTSDGDTDGNDLRAFMDDVDMELAYFKLHDKLVDYLENSDMSDVQRRALEEKLNFVEDKISEDEPEEDQNVETDETISKKEIPKTGDSAIPRGFRSRSSFRSRYRYRYRYRAGVRSYPGRARVRTRVRLGGGYYHRPYVVYHRPVVRYTYYRHGVYTYCYNDANQTRVCVYSGSHSKYPKFTLTVLLVMTAYAFAYFFRL